MIWACYKGYSEIIGLLLKAGARTDIQEKVAIAQSAFDWLATIHNNNMIMLCCVQNGPTALYWAAHEGYINIVQTLVNHSAAVDLGRDKVINHHYLLTCGWSFVCGFIVLI